MRTLFGIVLGAALTIGAAYYHDTMYAAASPATPGVARTIVNWDVASEVSGSALRGATRQLDRLIGR